MPRLLPSFAQFSLWQSLPGRSLACGLLSLTLVATPSLAAEKVLRTLTVTGRGTERVQTTIAQVQLGVEVQGKTAETAQQEAARRAAAVVAFLKSRPVEKLETTGIRLEPNYNVERVQRLVGYTASNTVSFRIDTQQAGTLLDEAVKAGATKIDSVSFVASDNAISAAQQQALRAATEDAQKQAATVLSALNLTKREVVSIQVNGASFPPPRPFQFARKAEAADLSTPIIGGEQQVEASVTLEISY